MSDDAGRTSFVTTLAQQLIRWRWLVLLATLVIVGFLASGARFLGFEGDYKIFFSEENPELEAYDALLDTYTRSDNVLFVLAPRDGRVFSADALAAVEALTEKAWQIPFSTRVDSVTNFQHVWAQGDDLIVEDLVSAARERSPQELERARRVALAEPGLRNRLISDDADTTGVNVTIPIAGDDPQQLIDVVGHVRGIADEMRREFPDVDLYLTGTIMLNAAFMEATMNDMATLMPLMYLVLLVLLFVFFRSLAAVLASFAVIGLSTFAALGAAGWLGIALTPPSAIAPTLIMTLAVADSVHILAALLDAMRRGLSKEEAIAESLRSNFQPVLLTSVTTAIGFLSMNSSDAPPLHDLGNITAVGVAAALALSLLFLPALIAVLPLKVRARAVEQTSAMDRLADFVIRHRRTLLLSTTVVVLLLIACIPLNELNDQFTRYFDERVQFRTDTDFVTENLTGLYQVEYSVGSGSAGGITDPGYLATLDAFADWWRRQPETIHVSTFTDTMKQLNKSMFGDDPGSYRLPERSDLAAQYLLLYEMSLPYGFDLNGQIDADKSATRFTVTLDEISCRELIDVARRGEQWLRDNAPPAMATYGVGSSIMFSKIADRNIRSMLAGTLIALVLISVCLGLALRSFRYGAVSLIPNLVPAAMGFGIWGLAVGRVGFGLSIVMAMTLGIVVDDTIHFLSKYLRARRERGEDAEAAVRYAFRSVGHALAVTTLTLVGGFLILSASSYSQNAEMGQLTAIIILLALLADFFLLPPLLMLIDGGKEPRSANP